MENETSNAKKAYTEFIYIQKEDYDKKIKVNSEDLPVYSKKKLNELHPEKDYEILGETSENKKRDKDKDIGRIELNEKRLYVTENGKHNKLFRKQTAFVEVNGGYIALLKNRFLIFILLGLLSAGIILGGAFALYTPDVGQTEEEQQIDINITPIPATVLTISGNVTKDGKPVDGATLSLEKGNGQIATASTDAEGKYLINDVKNGTYNLVCTNGKSVLTKIAEVDGESITVDFRFPADDLHDVEEITDFHDKEKLPESKTTEENSDVKAIVKITDENTPPISVGGLDLEAMLHMEPGKEVDLTFLATKIMTDNVPESEKSAIEAISGELEMTYYDFKVLKEVFKDNVLERSEYLVQTKTVLEIAVPFDSSHSVATYSFRYHDNAAQKMIALDSKPNGDFIDGTYYVSKDMVYIYSNRFSTYAIGAANTEQIVRGGDTITYSNKATVNLQTKRIEMLYKHDKDSTNAARIEMYLVGDNGNLLIAESDTIPVGYQLTGLNLKDGIGNMPSVGTYEGLMKIIYINEDNAGTDTNVDIPMSIAIIK